MRQKRDNEDLIKTMKLHPISNSSLKTVTADLPDLTDLHLLSQKTIDSLPEKFKKATSSLIVKVENFADQETLRNLKIIDRYDLLGLYKGTPLPVKRTLSSFPLPDVVMLYRCPLIRYARDSQETIEHLVHQVIIHEIGHHFGFNDYDLGWIENEE
jgi:predicted Zn-dependent protease with MMP-like domain